VNFDSFNIFRLQICSNLTPADSSFFRGSKYVCEDIGPFAGIPVNQLPVRRGKELLRFESIIDELFKVRDGVPQNCGITALNDANEIAPMIRVRMR
jgi:hypothetical protein